jgi:hypothetical protein
MSTERETSPVVGDALSDDDLAQVGGGIDGPPTGVGTGNGVR